jgi:hypothetical protein
MKQLLVITALISPLCLIVSTQVLAQTQPTEAEIQQACANRQIDKLPAPFSDVPSYHWASEAVANLYYSLPSCTWRLCGSFFNPSKLGWSSTRGGPNLEPGSVVDVVVGLRNGNKTYLVRSQKQKIQRTY